MMQIKLRFTSALQALFVAVSLLFASATQADFNPSSDYSDLSQRLTAVRTLPPDKRIDQMVQTIVLNRALESGCLQTSELALCVAPGTDEQTIQGILNRLPTPQLAYVGDTSWTKTATNSTTISRGQPITITYSFLPDGTYVPGNAGEPGSNSVLYSSFDAAFGGNRALWKAKFAEAFNQWAAFTSITYVEVADDGLPFTSRYPGVLGSRGDVRIAAHNIDGAYNILGYTYFPNNGDMVFDSSEAWGQGTNQIFFRNTCIHEHGHGLGLDHVWPLDHKKIMEPYLNTNIDGPQDDDIRGAVRSYGDYLESNTAPATATDIGSPGSSGITKSNLATFTDLPSSPDVDWFKLTASPLSFLTVRVVPLGSTYQVGPSDTVLTTVNTTAINNLQIEVYASNGSTLLTTRNSAPAGQTEELLQYPLASGRVYYVKISNDVAGAVDDVQRYSVTFSAGANTPPTITSVSVSPSVVAVGDPVQVTVSVVDPEGMQSVTANGVALTNTNGTWKTTIPAVGGLTTHLVNVVATDAAGAQAADSTKSYVDTRVLGINTKDIQFIPVSSTSQYLFKIAGRVSASTPTTIDLDDGSGTIVRVTAASHTLQVGDYASARGVLSTVSNLPSLASAPAFIQKLN